LNKRAPKLTVYSRAYCHLCDDMITGLRALQATTWFELEVVDVEHDPALEARFGERVPVLAGAGRELCHYRLDIAKVNEYLSKIG
jgi:hypothetical protein